MMPTGIIAGQSKRRGESATELPCKQGSTATLDGVKFDLNTTLHKHGGKGHYRIYVPKSEVNKLIALIGPHIHYSMQYKINSGFSSK